MGSVGTGRERFEVEWAAMQAEEPPLHAAARSGDHAAIRQLVAAGADLDEAFDIQLDPGARPVLITALGWASGSAEGATATTVEILIELGAGLAVEGVRPPLLCALAGVNVRHPVGGDLARVEILARAHLDALGRLPSDVATGAWLEEAVSSGDPDRVAFVLRHGADPNPAPLETWRRTPLDRAVSRDSIEVVRVLLESGADPNLRAFHLYDLLGTVRSVAVLDVLLDAGPCSTHRSWAIPSRSRPTLPGTPCAASHPPETSIEPSGSR